MTARERFAHAPRAQLATADASGRPHIVPITFALVDEVIYSAVDDAKPKRTMALRRLANIAENTAVSVLVDHYDEDWSALWWVRADGRARILDTAQPEAQAALRALAERYAAYRERTPPGPVIAIDVERWGSWSSSGG